MRRLPSILILGLAASALAGPQDQVYGLTRHGDAQTGVARLPTVPRGACVQCHALRAPAGSPLLFTADDNGLCFTCHQQPEGIFLGRAAFEATAHFTSGRMRWPGPTPPARPAGDVGKCVNCHTPHGARDALGLVPSLGFTREESLCLACHDSTGPSVKNILAELGKASTHPVTAFAGRHHPDEASGAAFGGANRHAECPDCHNPHAAQGGADAMLGVARVKVTNGAANTAPSYAWAAAGDPSPAREYEVCFKCHSGFTTLPAGAKDKGLELNPANASFHPVEAAGKGTSAALAQSLAGGTGLPHLTVNSTVWCSDCHASEAIPTTVSSLVGWDGGVTGPHGSNAAVGNAAYSTALLRAPYRLTSYTTYNQADYAFCFICHSPAPFTTSSKTARPDTNFRLHGFHMRGLGGTRNASCHDCHNSPHGTASAYWPSNRGYARLVSFSSDVTGTGTATEPRWSPGSCQLRCHNTSHSPETY